PNTGFRSPTRAKRIFPETGACKPSKVLSRVVFPEPLAPRMAVKLPRAMEMEIPDRRAWPPYPMARSCIAISSLLSFSAMRFRLNIYLLLGTVLTGCATMPPSSPALRQQAQADLVVNFQSWRSISFLKPDLTGTAGALTLRTKTFTREAVVKLLRNLTRPREFV